MLLGAVGVALVSARYFTLNPEAYFPRQREVYEANTLALILHVAGMVVALPLGPFQFLRSFRERHFRIHRAMGRLYISGALVGGLGGLYMAQLSASGMVSDFAFTLLALGTIGTTGTAYLRIRSGNVQAHREWMTRSFALMFAAVTLRLYAPFLEMAFGPQNGYALVAWICWLPNALIAEWLIRRRLRATPEPAFPSIARIEAIP